MKNIIKKWWGWFLLIGIAIIIFTIIGIKEYRSNKRIKESFKNIAESAVNYMDGIEKVDSHLNEFTYNYETGKAEYHPPITLKIYNKIEEGSTEREVISILGKENAKQEGENTYMLSWGDSYAPISGGYWIQIVFDKDGKVLKKYEVGLE